MLQPLPLICSSAQRTQFILNAIVTTNKDPVNYNLQEIYNREAVKR